MKILISTPVFKPMVGGMEVLADNFAVHFTRRGHEVTLVTPIPYDQADEVSYRVIRQPSALCFYRLAREADIIFSNGANLYAAPWTILSGTPMVMRHTGYQVACIDGAGWHDGRAAPLRPVASFLHHLKHGKLAATLRGIGRVTVLRLFAQNWVTTNVAISDWMKGRHPLPNQIRIHNPFPITKFVGAINQSGKFRYDFFFLGRLITEKGIDILLRAFAAVQSRSENRYRLCIIGDGPARAPLEALAASGGQADHVHFAGMLTGPPLIELVRECRVAVLPSTWEEPFGGVSTELLAAGKNVIVSRDGALSEIVADAGLTFPNGDADELADAMERMITDPTLRTAQLRAARRRITDFDEERLIDQYESLFNRILEK